MLDPNLLKLEDKKFLANKSDRASNTKQIIDKLEELKPQEPNEKQRSSQEARNSFFDALKGDKGEMPVYKKDYLTDEEMAQIKQELTPVKGIDYVDGEKGEDYVLTDADKKEIASNIKVPVVEKIIEKTEVIKEQPIVTNQIKEVAKYEEAEQIAEKLSTIKKAWLELSQIKGLQELLNESGNNFLQQAKALVPRTIAGMYDVNVQNISDQQALIWSASRQKFVPGSVTSTGGGFTKLLSIETPDGSNTVFTYSQKPLYIISGGAWYEENNGWTWNAGALQATLSVPPPAQSLQLLAFV